MRKGLSKIYCFSKVVSYYMSLKQKRISMKAFIEASISGDVFVLWKSIIIVKLITYTSAHYDLCRDCTSSFHEVTQKDHFTLFTINSSKFDGPPDITIKKISRFLE